MYEAVYLRDPNLCEIYGSYELNLWWAKSEERHLRQYMRENNEVDKWSWLMKRAEKMDMKEICREKQDWLRAAKG